MNKFVGAKSFRLQRQAFHHKQVLLRSEDIDISLCNAGTNNLTPAFCFSGKRQPFPVQLAFGRMVSTRIFALASLFILAERLHTPELRKSADPHGSRRLLSRNTVQDRGAGREPRRQKQLDPDTNWPGCGISRSSSVPSPTS